MEPLNHTAQSKLNKAKLNKLNIQQFFVYFGKVVSHIQYIAYHTFTLTQCKTETCTLLFIFIAKLLKLRYS